MGSMAALQKLQLLMICCFLRVFVNSLRSVLRSTRQGLDLLVLFYQEKRTESTHFKDRTNQLIHILDRGIHIRSDPHTVDTLMGDRGRMNTSFLP